MAEYSREFGNGRPRVGTVKTRRKPGVATEEEREKQSRATELRAAGASYGEIAKVLGYHDASGARKAVEAAIRAFQFESTRDALMLDLSRLDEWAKLCTHAIRTKGDLTQIDRLMRIMEKRHWLLGVTPATLAETDPNTGDQQTKGGMHVVVAASERTFVRGMMLAVGQDPDSPEGRAYLASRGLGENLAIEANTEEAAGKKNPRKRLKKRPLGATPTPGAPIRKGKKHKNTDVIDAEIVDEVIDKDAELRASARSISVRTSDDELAGMSVQYLSERKI